MTDEILKRLIKEKTSEALHTSAYAEAQNGGRIGVASSESFSHRMEVDKNRSYVKGYGDAKVRNEGGNSWERAGEFSVDTEASQRAAIREKFGGERTNATSDRGGNGGVGGVNSASKPSGWTPSGPAQPPARRNSGISR